METGIVTIQEPVSTKTNVGEAPAGVIVDKVNLSTVLDDEITSRDCRNTIILPGEADVSEVVNGSGNKETEEFESEKRETTLVEDSKIVKEKASEIEKDEQGSIFVHEPESFNKNKEDAKIILSDVTLEKEKEDNLIRKPEEVSVEKPVIEEDQVETKHSQEQEEEIDNISKACKEIPIKTDEVKEETESRNVETSVNGTEAEDNPMVSVEEISRNGVNIVNETVPEKETRIDGEPLHEIETIKKLEAEKEEDKEEMKIDEQPRLNAIEKVGTETVKTVIEDSEIVNNEETTVHESESLKENEEPVEAMKHSDDAEQTSSEVTVDREKNEAITQNTEEVKEIPRVIETPTIQGEDTIESKASLEVDKISEDTEEHEHVLVRDIPQGETHETLETEAETVDTSTLQEAGILKTNINETETMHSANVGEEDGQETKENIKPSQDLKEDKEEEETETVKSIISSDEVRSSDVQEEIFGEHTEPCSSEIKDESDGREKSVEVKSTENFQDESTEDLLDVPSTESEKNQDNEPETTLVADSESREKFEKSPSDLAFIVDKEELKDEKINVDQADGTQIMEEQRGIDSNGAEAEQVDRNRIDETEEIQVALRNVESVEQMQKPILESPSEVSEESHKTVDEKIGKKQEEEVTPHQEGQEEGSYGLETKEETVSIPKSSELREETREERNVIDLNPLQEESSQQNEQEKETKLEQHETIDEEVKSDEVTKVSSGSPSNELEDETVVEARKIENIKESEEEHAADKIPKSLETVESHSSLPSSSVEHDHGTVSENIEDEKVEAEQTRDIGLSLTEQCSMDQTQPEEVVKEACSRDEQENEISKNSENIVNETYALHSAEVAEETATNGESLNDVESTKRVLLEVKKEEEEAEMKTNTEPRLDAIEKEAIGTVKTVVEDAKIVNNEETTAHESESLKGDDHQDENAESMEAIRNSDDAEQISSEKEDITHKVEEVKESPQVIETPTVQGEDIKSKASLELKEEVDQSSKDTEEHVLGRDIPQCDTLEVEAVDTSTAQEAAILKTLETNINEAEDKELKETETVKAIIFSDEVTPSDQVDAQAEEFDEHTEACSSEIKDESQGRDESVEVNSKETIQGESSEEKDSGELEKYQDNEPETCLVSKTENRDKSEDIPSAVEGAGLDETTHNQTLVDVESVEKVQNQSLETPSELSEETSTTVDEKVEDSPKEEVTLHQEGQEEGSHGSETKEVTVSLPESKNLGEEAEEEASCLPNEKENEGETVVETEKIGDKNINEEEQVADKIHKSFETVVTVEPHSSLPSSSEDQEHGTISEKTDNGNGKETDTVALPLEEQEKVTSTEKRETKENEIEDDKRDEHVDFSTSLMLSEKNDNETLTTKAKKEDEEITLETLNTSENVCMQQEEFGKLETPKLKESKEDNSQEITETIKEIEATSDQTLPIEASHIDNTPSSELVSEQEDQAPKQVEEVHEEEAKEAQKVEATGDQNLLVKGEDIESKASLELKEEVYQSSKDTEEHVLGRSIPQCETIEVEAVDTSTAQEAAILKTLETNINEAEDKEQKETETVKDVRFSDEVRPSDQVDAQVEEFDEHTEACSSEIKDESQGRDESVEVNSKETVQGESSEEKDVNLLDVRSGELEKYQDNEPEPPLVSKTESGDKFEDIPSAVEGVGLDETLHKQTLLDVESVEKVQKPSVETPSELSKETSTTVDEKVEESPKEEVTLHQECQEEGCHGSETTEVTVSVPESKNLGEQAEEEASCLPNEKENETKLQEEKIAKYEPTKEDNDQQSPTEEKSDEVIDETVVEAEKIGDKSIDEEEEVADKIQKSFETVVTVEPHSSLPSSLEEQEHGTNSEKTDNGNGKETTDIVALPLEEQEKVTSTSPMLSEKNDNETLTTEAKKEDEEITMGTLNTSENVCMQQEEFVKLETPKLDESKEDKSQEIDEIIKDTSDQTLPIEASQIDNTLYSELVSEQEDQTPKQVEEIHEEEAKEAHNLNSEEILHTEIIPKDSSDGPLASMLASKEDGQVTLEVDNCEEYIREANDTQDEQHVSAKPEKSEGETKPKEPEDEIRDEKVETPTSPIVSEKNDNETLIVETKKEDEDTDEIETPMAFESSGTSKKSENVGIKQEQFGNHEVPKLEESKEEKRQEITETAKAIEATGDQTLPIETSQVDQTLSSELVSGFDDQTPRKVEEIHEEEVKEERKFEAKCDKNLPVETSQECQTPSSDLASGPDDQTPKQVEEVHEEETKEEHKLQVASDKILPVETSQEDQIPKQIEEIQILEEETKETHKVQPEDILSNETVPRESFSEAPVSMLASREDESVTPQEGGCTSDTQEEQHVSAETGERVEEPKLIKLPKVEDESAKKTDVEVAELTNDYPTEEAEHGDETYSTLPVVGILTELQTTLESERSVNDFASSGENMIKERADQEQKKGDFKVESNEDFVSKIIEGNRLQQDQSGETEKIQEENGLAGKSLPVEELNLQEEHKEEVKVQDGISRDFEVNVAEKQEESKAQKDASLQEEHPRDFELSKKVGDHSDQVMESELPVDQPQTEQKKEIHETVKEEDQIVDFKDVKKSEEVHDEKLECLSATTDTKETFSSQMKKIQEDAGELGVGHDIASLQVEKEEEPHTVLGNDEEINEVVTSEKQIIDPVVIIKKAEHESNEEHIQPQAISDDTESNIDRVFPTEEVPKDQREEVSADKSLTKEALDEQIQVPSSALLDDQDLSIEKPSELVQPDQSPNQVEETSFEVKKAQEDINEETVDALITNENVQVQDQPPKEAPAKEKETSEHKQKSSDLTHVQETGLTEEKRELDNVKTELEDAIKHEVTVEEKNNTSENIDGEATKEINQKESKQTYAVKEEIKEEEKETSQESFNNVKKTDDAIDKTQPEIRKIESFCSVSKTHENSEQEDEVSKLENPKIAEEIQQKDRESENNKGQFSEVKETEPTLKEPARKSLSDLIQKVKGTNKIEDATTTTEPHIEEEAKTEEEEDDGDHEDNKDDKTSPDSLVMVEAKDTVSIIKTHKKSHGILSQVKHSISKVKKVLTGKSSHTTKPSSPT